MQEMTYKFAMCAKYIQQPSNREIIFIFVQLLKLIVVLLPSERMRILCQRNDKNGSLTFQLGGFVVIFIYKRVIHLS